MSKFGHERLKVVYAEGVPELHATEDRQIHDEDLIWSLYHPILALFLMTLPVETPVPRKPEIDDEYMKEMKDLLGEAGELGAEFFRLREQLDVEQNPTRQATSFPVKLIGIDNMPLEGHAGLEFLKTELGGREIVTVAELEAIAEKFKSRPK